MIARRFQILALAAATLAAAGARAADPPAPASEAPADTRPPGQKLYGRYCLTCHQADGGGVPNMQPPIAGGSWVKGDSKALALFVLTGGSNSAERKDSAVDNVMPGFPQLSDEDLAEILSYIRAKFGDGGSPVTAAEVSEARSALPK